VLELRHFCNLLLFFVIFTNIILLPNAASKQESILSVYNAPTNVYAQHQQPVLPAKDSQEWIDKQSNTKIQFTYSPDKPLVSGFTDLKFNLEDSKRGTQLKDVLARITVIGVLPQKMPLKYYSIKAPNGNFSVKYQFPLEGTYQIFVKADSKNSSLALASFKVFVPFRPVGTININYIYPILMPLGLVALVGALAILSFMLLVNKMKKS
jgi:hypothetical protein